MIEKFNAENLSISSLSSSELQADVFVKFMSEVDYLVEVLDKKSISPRYNDEDISFLNLKIDEEYINKLWIPMACFCDIPLSRIDSHILEYGEFGIALKREWGIKRKLTPITYILHDSEMHKELRSLISFANKSEVPELQSYIFNVIFYSKPIVGVQSNKPRKFIEEQEWRYVPDISTLMNDFAQYYYKEDMNVTVLSNLLKAYDSIQLKFDFEDVKYLIVPKDRKVELIEKIMQSKEIEEGIEKYKVISKIVSISEIKEDFL